MHLRLVFLAFMSCAYWVDGLGLVVLHLDVFAFKVGVWSFDYMSVLTVRNC